MTKASFIFIYITTPTIKSAKKIANILLEKKLIACANIIPKMNSLYSWKGKIEQSNECILILKTKKSHYISIEKIVLKNHPYDTPCVLEIPLGRIEKRYKLWLENKS